MPDPFKEPLDLPETMLYSDASVSTFQAVGMLFSWFTAFSGISKQVFSCLLFLLHTFLLPKSNTLPSSYAEALMKVKHYIVPVQEFHCCVNDCLLFTKAHASDTHCPICGESRYELGSQRPRKRFK